MKYRYPVSAPDLSGNELRYVQDCMESTWISSQGPYLQRFEEQIASLAGTEHALAVCNGTVALHLALVALGVAPGDEVIIPSLTFIATANAVSYCGATPVFADCDPQTWCIDPESIERLLTPRTVGIIPVHLYGHPCEMDRITDLADKQRLWVVEDCAEAAGAIYHGRRVGSFGKLATFSFFANKIVVTGEGGAIVTNDAQCHTRMQLLRGQGMDPQKRYWHTTVGYNYRMTNLAAAIGVAQMERLDRLLEDRSRLARWYDAHLAGIPNLTLPYEAPKADGVNWMYSLLTDCESQRDELRAGLLEQGIETRPFFCPIHEMPPYRLAPTDQGCPVTRDVSSRGLSLPTASYLNESDVTVISEVVRSQMSRSRFRRAA